MRLYLYYLEFFTEDNVYVGDFEYFCKVEQL